MKNENLGALRRVLVVEDEVLICMLIETILDDAGYQVLTANSLSDALDTIDRETFDLAILDLNLQGKKVYPAAQALAAKGIPFVFATGAERWMSMVSAIVRRCRSPFRRPKYSTSFRACWTKPRLGRHPSRNRQVLRFQKLRIEQLGLIAGAAVTQDRHDGVTGT
jgi:DNA-binding response OmpR family regulator